MFIKREYYWKIAIQTPEIGFIGKYNQLEVQWAVLIDLLISPTQPIQNAYNLLIGISIYYTMYERHAYLWREVFHRKMAKLYIFFLT